MDDLVQRARTYLGKGLLVSGKGYWRIFAEHESKDSEDRDITELVSDMADRIERLEGLLRRWLESDDGEMIGDGVYYDTRRALDEEDDDG